MKTIKIHKDNYGQWSSWVRNIDLEEFQWPWKIEDWENLSFDNYSLYLQMKGETPVGFSLFHSLKGDDGCHLLKIIILKGYQGTGLGKSLLMNSLEGESDCGKRHCFLEVEKNNVSARNLYEGLGFRYLRVIKGFYRNGDDAVAYEKSWSV